MKHVIRVLIVLSVLWSGYWAVTAWGLRQSIAGWFEQRTTIGWQADFAAIETNGYPLHHRTTLTNPALADPETGTAWRADWVSFDSPAIWPGHQTLRFADTAQWLSYFDHTLQVTAQDLTADLRLHPGVALQLERMALTAGPWSVLGNTGEEIAARSLTVAMVQQTEPEAYQFDILADGFRPGARWRDVLQPTDTLPDAFETLKLELAVRFDRPWDRAAIEQQRPQPVHIDLKLADLHWGALRVQATGAVNVDPQGVPTGEIALQAENWREMLAMAQAAGAIPASVVSPAERVLKMLAGIGGNPQSLDVTLSLRDGYVALGPIPIGPAPRLFLR